MGLDALASEADTFDVTDQRSRAAVEARISELLRDATRAKQQKQRANLAVALFARRILVARRSSSHASVFTEDYLTSVVGVCTKHGALKWIRSQLLYMLLPADLQPRIKPGNCAELLRFVDEDAFALDTWAEVQSAVLTRLPLILELVAQCGTGENITRAKLRECKSSSSSKSSKSTAPTLDCTMLSSASDAMLMTGVDASVPISLLIEKEKERLKALHSAKKCMRQEYRSIAPPEREHKSKNFKLQKLQKKRIKKEAKMAELDRKLKSMKARKLTPTEDDLFSVVSLERDAVYL